MPPLTNRLAAAPLHETSPLGKKTIVSPARVTALPDRVRTVVTLAKTVVGERRMSRGVGGGEGGEGGRSGRGDGGGERRMSGGVGGGESGEGGRSGRGDGCDDGGRSGV